jgi:hypothetical protein
MELTRLLRALPEVTAGKPITVTVTHDTFITTVNAAAAPGSRSLLGATKALTASLPAYARGVAAMATHAWALLWYPRPLHRTDSFAYATTLLGAWWVQRAILPQGV